MTVFFRSVKFRLTVWYAVILTVFLSLFAFLMYWELARTLYRDIDSTLFQQAVSVEQSLRQVLAAAAGNGPGISKQRFIETVQAWEDEEEYLQRATRMIRLVAYDHSAVISNLKGWEKEIIFPSFERDSVFMEEGRSFQTIHFRRNPVRLYYHLMRWEGRPLLVIQTAMPLHDVERALSRLVFIFLIWVPVAVGAAGIAGWLLARRSLRPIDSMIEEARLITAAYLKGRLPRTATGDELDRLAATLNEMMDRLALSTKAVQEFSSNVSHELKTPLAIIRGEIDLALRKSRSVRDLEETLRTIGEEVNGLIRLVDDLMLLVRSDSRQLRLEKKPVNLRDVLIYVAERFKDRAQAKNIRMSSEFKDDIEFEGDEVYLKRLFSNLLENAIKFTDEGGWVRFSLRYEDGKALVEIADNGIGIEPAIQEKVFSRFYRTDQARTQEGAGLGLNIAKAICDAHQGLLTLQSLPGQGTTVRIILPVLSSPHLP